MHLSSQVFNGVQDLKTKLRAVLPASVVTIGNFDGVHRGHQHLIQTVVMEASMLQVPSVVYTFHPHPVRVLHPDRPTYRLFDQRDQQEQLAKAGVQMVVCENFNREFAQMSAQDFLTECIFKPLHPLTLVVGHDFSFGANRHGDLHFLEKFCSQHNIKLVIIPPYQLDNQVVSSSKIREELKAGALSQAEKLLGRKYYLRGKVEHGFQRGRTIGVPTANVHPDVEFIPRQGVYVTLLHLFGKEYQSITNIGINPTFEGNREKAVKVETHIFDFDSQIYGDEVEVTLLAFLRDEKKFSGLEELRIQIQKDLQQARGYFENR